MHQGDYMFVNCASVIPELIEAQVQPSRELAIRVPKEVWNVFTVMSHVGNL